MPHQEVPLHVNQEVPFHVNQEVPFHVTQEVPLHVNQEVPLHVTQEVPLPPYFSIAFVTLRTMFSLVGGRVEEGSIVNNAKLFW